MMLRTSDPQLAKYELSYGHRLVDYDSKEYSTEEQLNVFLQSDENTSGCSVVPGSIKFYEPGSTAGARVSCQKPIKVEAQDSYGSPLRYYYMLQDHFGSKPAT